ncbi:MOSC domain-containing protein [Olivibacter sp. XZL3]|uniref:MOSC domain-containing protein n=1 Tax=Olivibacter sp. XZL3 TaxID=1735116 RepID=UPI001064C12F|nr:MOSC N-terminal beta barrel domain-containing protein [Olivibacter sp. XZL3]
MLTISELFVYPIKSLGGVSLRQAHVTDRGLQYDRRWMLIDSQNRFLTQREYPQMALLTVLIGADGLSVVHPEMGTIRIPFESAYSDAEEVRIWEDCCTAVLMGSDFDAWFSEALGMNCRLVYMPDSTERQVDQRYAAKGAITSFSDAYPFLLIGQASLDDLNRRLETPLPMNRFRPNIVFTGAEPFEEDRMNHIRIGDKIDFYGVKLCARCVMTTIDQQSGEKSKEPLKTLASYRSKNKKILFGQNLVHQGNGTIEVGDSLEVLTKHAEERFMV